MLLLFFSLLMSVESNSPSSSRNKVADWVASTALQIALIKLADIFTSLVWEESRNYKSKENIKNISEKSKPPHTKVEGA
jgi:hypothetical protein